MALLDRDSARVKVVEANASKRFCLWGSKHSYSIIRRVRGIVNPVCKTIYGGEAKEHW